MRPRVELVNFSETKASLLLSYLTVIRCFALVALLILGASCGGRKKPATPTPSPSSSPTPIPVGLAADSATWTIRKNNQRLLTLTADTAEAEPDASGKLGARLTGQKATLFRNDTAFMELTGEVRADEAAATVTVKNATAIFLQDDFRVSSDTIVWNRDTRRISGEGNVRAKLGSTEIQGKRFVANERLTKIEIDQ